MGPVVFHISKDISCSCLACGCWGCFSSCGWWVFFTSTSISSCGWWVFFTSTSFQRFPRTPGSAQSNPIEDSSLKKMTMEKLSELRRQLYHQIFFYSSIIRFVCTFKNWDLWTKTPFWLWPRHTWPPSVSSQSSGINGENGENYHKSDAKQSSFKET